MKDQLDKVRAGIADNLKDFEAMNNAVVRALDGVNLSIQEIINPKITGAHLIAHHNVLALTCEIQLALVYATDQGPQTFPVAKMNRPYPFPADEAIVEWIMEEVRGQISDRFSPLMIALSTAKATEGFLLRAKLTQRR